MAGNRIIDSLGGLKIPRRGTENDNGRRKPQGALVAKAGVGKPEAVSGSNGAPAASSIGSPLIEVPGEEGSEIGSRSYHEELQTLRSTDGIFIFEYYNIYTMKFTDPSENVVEFQFEDIPPPNAE